MIKIQKAQEVKQVCGAVTLYYGDPGTGKTYNSLSYPGPIFVIDTDQRASLVYNQLYKDTDKEVYIVHPKNWQELSEAMDFYGEFLKTAKTDTDDNVPSKYRKPTIVVDSCTALIAMAQEHYNLKYGNREEINFAQWNDISSMVDERIFFLRSLPTNIVLTAQMKDEFADETRTGRRILDCYKRIPYWADVTVLCRKAYNEKGEFERFVGMVTKNGIGKSQSGEIPIGINGILSLER